MSFKCNNLLLHLFLNCCQNFSSWIAFRLLAYFFLVIQSVSEGSIFFLNRAGCALLPQNLTAIFHIETQFLFLLHLLSFIVTGGAALEVPNGPAL